MLVGAQTGVSAPLKSFTGGELFKFISVVLVGRRLCLDVIRDGAIVPVAFCRDCDSFVPPVPRGKHGNRLAGMGARVHSTRLWKTAVW